MWYQPLSLSDGKNSSELVAAYSGARRRLTRQARREVPEPPALPAPLQPPPRPKLNVFASVLTLQEADDKIPAKKILSAVADAHSLRMGDILGPRRWNALVNARHHAVAIILLLRPDLSLPLIGRLMNRDHTTIINARRRWPRIKDRYEKQTAAVFERLCIQSPVDSANNLHTDERINPHNDNMLVNNGAFSV